LIAKELSLNSEDMIELKYACFLHDIGKIYIETELLQKIKLDKDEMNEIRKHSERGAKIIEGIRFLEGVREAVLHHQERYDGKGYPAGLKGEDIPLLARIISVADAFDAMTTDRPYKKKISFKDAMDEIQKHAGTQFDPKIAKALLKYKDEIEGIAKKHFGSLP
jgi:HD-GYP domain-containing protein (c-di-GMP phosphodiesterase class II)